MQITLNATGGHGARIKTSPIVIFELILDSLPKGGTPAQALFTYLQGVFASNPDRVQYIQCPFYIGPEGTAAHLEHVSTAISALEK
jgi:hypothetical protein